MLQILTNSGVLTWNRRSWRAKYLGDQLCGLGLAESVAASASKRKGIVTRTIFEIRAVIEDCCSNARQARISGKWLLFPYSLSMLSVGSVL